MATNKQGQLVIEDNSEHLDFCRLLVLLGYMEADELLGLERGLVQVLRRHHRLRHGELMRQVISFL